MAFRSMFKVGEVKELGDKQLQVEVELVPEKPANPKKKNEDKPAFVKVAGTLTFSAKHPELMRMLRGNKQGLVFLDLTSAEDEANEG